MNNYDELLKSISYIFDFICRGTLPSGVYQFRFTKQQLIEMWDEFHYFDLRERSKVVNAQGMDKSDWQIISRNLKVVSQLENPAREYEGDWNGLVKLVEDTNTPFYEFTAWEFTDGKGEVGAGNGASEMCIVARINDE